MSPVSTQPVALGQEPSFGFGDRLGLATPGHLEALKEAGGPILPVLAQQSIREMTRTQRTPQQVMQAAVQGVTEAKYTGKWGADADHLKTQADVDATLAAGFVLFTIDPSDYVDPQADQYDPTTLAAKYQQIRDEVSWAEQYIGQTIKLKGRITIQLDELTVQRAAVKYGRAVNHAIKLSSYIHLEAAKIGRDFEIELSVDETPQPTTPAEHYIIADQCLKNGMKLVSLAPRFVGDFEKAVDFKGDLKAFEKSLNVHAAIARALGPYKLSLHSGSDKLSVYASFARLTKGLFHVKTAGTSYLEALRVVARHDEKLFRRIIDFARKHYETDKATYHVSATLKDVPPPGEIADARKLQELYLGTWDKVPPGQGFTNPGRQILHCTFGSVITDPQLGPALLAVLKANRGTYRKFLAEHFSRHLTALRQGMENL